MSDPVRATRRRRVVMRLGFALRLVVETDGDGGWGLRLVAGRQTVARCARPAAAQLTVDGGTAWVRAGYERIVRAEGHITGFASLVAGSSRIDFVDTLERRSGALLLTRTVRVAGDTPRRGFLTAVEWELDRSTAEDPWFVPGVWYGRNLHAPAGAIGAPDTRAARAQTMIREDRLPLPLVLHADEGRGVSFSLSHPGATAETIAADDAPTPLVDARLGFGSLGTYDGGRTVAFWHPGTEGETTYPPMWTIRRGNSQADSRRNPFDDKPMEGSSKGWVYRHLPLSDGVEQRYAVRVDIISGTSWLTAADAAWEKVKGDYRPAVVPCDLEEIERLCVSLLGDMVRRVGPAVGIPTWVDCYTAAPGRLQNTFGIGVVARNLEVAYFLLLYGVRWGIRGYGEAGAAILDFWTARSGDGLARTELDPSRDTWVETVSAEGAPILYLRDESDAHRSCLAAWSLEYARSVEHPRWLAWAKSYGEWLLSHQNPDGSFYRAYTVEGTPAILSTGGCAHVVPFLVDMERAVGGGRYVDAAIGTARFLWSTYHSRGEFFGGTLDNPDCTDKEGASTALEAYLCLFDATGARLWLRAAEVAARVCETWVFQWNVPMPSDDPDRFFPAGRATAGYQLITSGFSAFDMYLTRHVGDFFRLARLTGNRRYACTAELLLYNTKNTIQRAGELGYARPGFQIEHFSTGRGRGYGLNSGWLPWVATSHLLSIEEARRARRASDGRT